MNTTDLFRGRYYYEPQTRLVLIYCGGDLMNGRYYFKPLFGPNQVRRDELDVEVLKPLLAEMEVVACVASSSA
jgi:hypothetical protein